MPSSNTLDSTGVELLSGEVFSGQESLPVVRAAIHDPAEPGAFRLEAVALPGDMKGALAEPELLAILGDRTMEDRFRHLTGARYFEDAWRSVSVEGQVAIRVVVRSIRSLPAQDSTAG